MNLEWNEKEILADLFALYDDGRKMPMWRCWRCGFAPGLYFAEGVVRRDPGCYCASLTTKPGRETFLLTLIRRVPAKAQRWIETRKAEIFERAERERAFEKMLREKGPIVMSKPKRRRKRGLADYCPGLFDERRITP